MSCATVMECGVIDEANLKLNGMGYGEETLVQETREWYNQHLEKKSTHGRTG